MLRDMIEIAKQHKSILCVGERSLPVAEAILKMGKDVVLAGVTPQQYNPLLSNHMQNVSCSWQPVSQYLGLFPTHAFDLVITSLPSDDKLFSQAPYWRTLQFGGLVIDPDTGDGTIKKPGFLVASYPRCGTNMLVSALASHPELSVCGEIFNPATQEGSHGLKRTADVLELGWHKPQAGFAVHAYIGEKGGLRNMVAPPIFTDVWKTLPKDIPVIQLRRRDLLARHVSHIMAKESAVWNVYNNDTIPKRKKCTVSRDAVLADTRFVKTCWKKIKTLFPGAMVVYYEDLVDNWDQTVETVQRYLRVQPQAVQPGSKKIGKPLEESIANWEYVQKHILHDKYMQQYIDGTMELKK